MFIVYYHQDSTYIGMQGHRTQKGTARLGGPNGTFYWWNNSYSGHFIHKMSCEFLVNVSILLFPIGIILYILCIM